MKNGNQIYTGYCRPKQSEIVGKSSGFGLVLRLGDTI